jgi:ATP-dependent Clp protease ATP-binding subunit ClpA
VFERFTRSARAAVKAAEEKARETTASEVRPEHLLTALLDDPACLAVRVLERRDAPPSALREELDRRRRHHVDGLDADDAAALAAIGIDLDEVVRRIDRNLGGLAPTGRRARPRFSRSSRKVLELSLREALALRHNYIGTEHLLLGLARGGDRVATDALGHFGLDSRSLRAAVAEEVRRAG